MLTFENIMTQGIIYYDQEYVEECKEFCRARNISYLPHINDNTICYYYDRDKKNFQRRRISKNQIVLATDNIFEDRLISNFKKFEVCFIQQNQRIVGVVHYSDYNRAPVYENIYKKLYQLERGLVYLFVEHARLTKTDLQKFLNPNTEEKSMTPLSESDFRGKEVSLRTILLFTQKVQLLKIRVQDIKQIIKIRNRIAHSDNLISKVNNNSLNFSIHSLSDLIYGNNSIEVVIRQLSNRLYFMKAVTDDDYSAAVVPIDIFLNKFA